MSTPCHACNGQTTQALKEIITLIGGREFVSQVKHTVCQNCGCNWVEDEEWKRADILAALSSFRSRHTFGGSSLYSVRHILGLTRDQLSGILGLPVKTLYDMEEGLTEITQSVFNAVEALVLKALPQPAPKPSALSLSIPISCEVTYSPQALCYVASIQGVDIVSQGQTPEQAAASLADSITMTLRYLYPK